VEFRPGHPLEPQLHQELREALNRDLSTTDFFVWIGVEPTGERDHFDDLPSIVDKTEQWLAGLDPGAINQRGNLPRQVILDPAAEVEIQAIPKKESARGSRSGEVVGNPAPILVGLGT